MGRFNATLQVLFYYTEFVYYIYLLLGKVELYATIWWVLLIWLLTSVSSLNLVSVIRAKYQMDFYHKRFGLFVCSVMHLVLQGPLWRYIKLICVYEENEFLDFSRMSLLQSCVFSIPVIVFTIRSYLLTMHTVSFYQLMGCTISYSVSVISFTNFTSFSQEKESNIINPVTQVLGFLWRVFMIFARVSTFIWAFSSPYYIWITLAIVLKCLLLIIWFQLQENCNKCSHLSHRVWLIGLALAHLVDLTCSEKKTSLTWLVAYYSLNLSETTGVVILWHFTREQNLQNFNHLLWVMTAFACFAIGLLLSLGVKSYKAREDQGSFIQKALRCCCPGSKRERLERVSYIWDSYDTKNKLLSAKPMYTREQRQHHIDIINCPLGVGDSISLTNVTLSCTAKSTTCSTAPVEEVSKESSSRTEKPQQIQVDMNIANDENDPKRPFISTPFYLSPAGLHASAMPSTPPSFSTTEKPWEHSSLHVKINKSLPRRRLLFLTPSGLQALPDAAHIRNGDRNLIDGYESLARPRWVDLNKYYGIGKSKRDHFNDPKMIKGWLHHSETQVSEKSVIGKTSVNSESSELETKL